MKSLLAFDVAHGCRTRPRHLCWSPEISKKSVHLSKKGVKNISKFPNAFDEFYGYKMTFEIDRGPHTTPLLQRGCMRVVVVC